MVGELGDRRCMVADEGFERLCDALVEALATGDAEVLVEGVLDEGVLEPEAAGELADLGDERGVGGGLEEVEQGVLVVVGDGVEDAEVELAADHRGEGQHPADVVAEPIHPADHDVADAARERGVVEVDGEYVAAGVVERDGTVLVEVTEELAGEERVAVGLLVERAGKRESVGLHLVTGRALHQREELLVAQPAQRGAVDPGLTAEVGEERGERMVSGEVGVAIGHDHQHGRRCPADEEVAQHLQRRGVGPLQVVEDDDEPLSRGVGQQPADRLEEREALAVGHAGGVTARNVGQPATQRGHQPSQDRPVGVDVRGEQVLGGVLDEVGEHLDPRLVRDREPFGAVTEEDRRAVGVQRAGRLRRERGLADARLAGEEGDLGARLFARSPRRVEQEVELLDAAEEAEQPLGGRADHAGRQRHLAGRGFGLPLHLHRRHRVGDALELELADRREAVGAVPAVDGGLTCLFGCPNGATCEPTTGVCINAPNPIVLDVKPWVLCRPTIARSSSVVRIWPPVALSHRRAASTTQSP